MNYNRRNFLKASSASALGILTLPYCSPQATNTNGGGVGLQLYTIRDAISSDLEGSLEKVADLGYVNLELASYSDGKFYGKSPEAFKQLLDSFGLKAISSHTVVEAESEGMSQSQQMADAHAELGVSYCIHPWVQEEDRIVESYRKLCGSMNSVGETMKKVGIQFGYHNHNFEFADLDGTIPYFDIFLKELEPELVTMELDCFWATKAGQDPVEMFDQYPGRFRLLHLKDMSLDNAPYYTIEKDDIVSVGEGLIDFKKILAASEKGGVKYGFVEDDNQGSGTPFKAIETSINNLNQKILT
ncbi:MAG: sugar phosphate isomerase/epimerase [Bacteroidota bacterium]